MRELALPTKFQERPSAARIRGAVRVLGLCLFILYLVHGPAGLDTTLDALRGLRPHFWLLACGCGLVPPLAIALRLKALLRGTGHYIGYGTLARDSLRSTTLNTVTLMGTGDLYRLNRLRTHGVPLITGSALAVVDRVFGVGALASIAIAIQITGLGRTVDGARTGIGLAAAVLVAILAGYVVTKGRLSGPVRERLAPLAAVFGDRGPSITTLTEATVLSFIACTAWVFSVYFLGQGLGLSIPLIAYFEAAPLVALATFLPITIGGIGIREAGYVLLLGSYGASPTVCIALGIAQYSTFLAVAALGAVLFTLPERDVGRGLETPVG